jgi:hypothetical protein
MSICCKNLKCPITQLSKNPNFKYIVWVILVWLIIWISFYIFRPQQINDINLNLNNQNHINYYYNISWYEDLSDITTKTTFSDNELKQFEDKLLILESKEKINYQDVIGIARYNNYLWKTGKAIVVYENYFENDIGTEMMYNNLWWLVW